MCHATYRNVQINESYIYIHWELLPWAAKLNQSIFHIYLPLAGFSIWRREVESPDPHLSRSTWNHIPHLSGECTPPYSPSNCYHRARWALRNHSTRFFPFLGISFVFDSLKRVAPSERRGGGRFHFHANASASPCPPPADCLHILLRDMVAVGSHIARSFFFGLHACRPIRVPFAFG